MCSWYIKCLGGISNVLAGYEISCCDIKCLGVISSVLVGYQVSYCDIKYLRVISSACLVTEMHPVLPYQTVHQLRSRLSGKTKLYLYIYKYTILDIFFLTIEYVISSEGGTAACAYRKELCET